MKKSLIILLSGVLLSTISLKAQNDTLSREFGYPTSDESDRSGQLVQHKAYTLLYCENAEQAYWVSYTLTPAMLNGPWPRTDNFRADPMVTTGSATPNDYKNSGYDRGHLAPAADMSWDSTAMSESFYMSNMSPQLPGFNRGVWKRLEDQERSWASEYSVLWIVDGPVLTQGLTTIGSNKVAVPRLFYKVILFYRPNEVGEVAFIFPNDSSSKPLSNFVVSVDSVERLTGFDFFPTLPDPIERSMESKASSMTFSMVPLPDTETTPASTSTITTQSTKTQEETDTTTVYITKTGSKYHRYGCSYLKSCIPISRQDAKARGYTPCSRCNP